MFLVFSQPPSPLLSMHFKGGSELGFLSLCTREIRMCGCSGVPSGLQSCHELAHPPLCRAWCWELAVNGLVCIIGRNPAGSGLSVMTSEAKPFFQAQKELLGLVNALGMDGLPTIPMNWKRLGSDSAWAPLGCSELDCSTPEQDSWHTSKIQPMSPK